MEPGSFNFYDGEDFSLSYDVLEDRACLHCRVFQWNHRTLRKLYDQLARLLSFMEKQGAKAVYTISPNPKFCELMGGLYCADIQYNNQPYKVYKWELKSLYLP